MTTMRTDEQVRTVSLLLLTLCVIMINTKDHCYSILGNGIVQSSALLQLMVFGPS